MKTSKAYDVVILGSGPAGLQAAIHAARKKVSVAVLGRLHRSSLFDAHVENFCCMISMTGEEILTTGREQAERFGAEFLDEDVLDIRPGLGDFTITTESTTIHSPAVILAVGATRNKLGVPGEKELLGKGVSYCVDCDAGFYRGADVVVAGSASAAVHGALTLTRFAANVHLVGQELAVSDVLEQELRASGVHLHEGRKVAGIDGRDAVTGVTLDNGESIPAAGIFVELGAKGVMELAGAMGVALDENMKYIVTDKQQKTNVPGVFAAGDICGPPLQMAKAVGEGCVAGMEAASLAKKRQRGGGGL